MKSLIHPVMLLAALGLWPTLCMGQSAVAPGSEGGYDALNIQNLQKRHWVVAGKVTTLQGAPVLGARVVVEPAVAGEFRTVKTDVQGQFVTDYWLNGEQVKEFTAEVVVVKQGFLKAQTLVDLTPSDKPQVFPIILRGPREDARLLSQAALVSALAPRLKDLKASDGLSAPSQKDYARGVAELLEGRRPERAVPLLTRVVRRDTSCLGCRTMLGLAKLAAGDWGGAQLNFGEAANALHADAAHARPEPLVAYGVMESWRYDFKNAAAFFLEALQFTPQDPLALQELGRSQVLLANWGPAIAYLQKALEAGAGPDARLLCVEAQAHGGNPEEADQEMARYLDGRNVKAMPARVREVWAEVGDRKKAEAERVRSGIEVNQRIDYLHRTTPELAGLVPATDQAGLDPILAALARNVAEFFQNFPNTSSLERVHEEKMTQKGKVTGSHDEKFRYLCFTPPEAFGPGFSEFRMSMGSNQATPGGPQEGYMLTSGFASHSLLFHPAYLAQSTFRYLGRQKVNGRDAFVIAFAQQPAKARSTGEFKSGNVSVPVFSQGLVWVDAENYQIVRLLTDLLQPLPKVRLIKETTQVDYGQVHFNKVAQAFWLPREVTVTVDWNGRLLRNVHQYSDFKVFSVDTTEKVGKPKPAGGG